MGKRWDVQSIFDIGKLVVMVTMIAVTITEALTLMTGIMMLAFPLEEDINYLTELGNTLSTILFGISSVIMWFMAHRYFKNVCLVGTPFTHAGAMEVKRMAIVCAVSQGVALLGSYVVDFLLRIPVPEARLTHYDGLVLAAVLFVASYVLEHGAKVDDKVAQYSQRIAQLQKGKE